MIYDALPPYGTDIAFRKIRKRMMVLPHDLELPLCCGFLNLSHQGALRPNELGALRYFAWFVGR